MADPRRFAPGFCSHQHQSTEQAVSTRPFTMTKLCSRTESGGCGASQSTNFIGNLNRGKKAGVWRIRRMQRGHSQGNPTRKRLRGPRNSLLILRSRMWVKGRVRSGAAVARLFSGQTYSACIFNTVIQSAGEGRGGIGLAVFHARCGRTGRWKRMDGKSQRRGHQSTTGLGRQRG